MESGAIFSLLICLTDASLYDQLESTQPQAL